MHAPKHAGGRWRTLWWHNSSAMDRRDLVDALEALDACLTAPVDLLVIGGAAMILHFQAARATRDMDVIMLRGDLP